MFNFEWKRDFTNVTGCSPFPSLSIIQNSKFKISPPAGLSFSGSYWVSPGRRGAAVWRDGGPRISRRVGVSPTIEPGKEFPTANERESTRMEDWKSVAACL
jgi:hypothetical protein